MFEYIITPQHKFKEFVFSCVLELPDDHKIYKATDALNDCLRLSDDLKRYAVMFKKAAIILSHYKVITILEIQTRGGFVRKTKDHVYQIELQNKFIYLSVKSGRLWVQNK